MDFIEKWFGVSPDGGDGTTELMYLVVLIVVVVALPSRPELFRQAAPLTFRGTTQLGRQLSAWSARSRL
jgi:hypothetical protein